MPRKTRCKTPLHRKPFDSIKGAFYLFVPVVYMPFPVDIFCRFSFFSIKGAFYLIVPVVYIPFPVDIFCIDLRELKDLRAEPALDKAIFE